jgi:hypothetical protein
MSFRFQKSNTLFFHKGACGGALNPQSGGAVHPHLPIFSIIERLHGFCEIVLKESNEKTEGEI